ncbi:MAG: UDP-3-O-(3-hydroxymyristoyl)glucosamine N-acyltransferase [Deltaproteobacteria bacterium]|nr:UDP-3-O-(3-hydroxymyristoyl)glucosamine N-acyltransferase [Deltaproteobacteria bacterium]
MQMTLKEIAALVGGTIEGDPETLITGLAGIDKAQPGDISFVASPKYEKYIETTGASAIVCAQNISAAGKNLLKVDNPYLVYAKALRYLNPPPPETGRVDERAALGKDVTVGQNVTVHPFASIGDGCVIADGVTIYPGCFIGNGVSIGENTFIYPNVTIREHCIIGKRVIIHPGTVIGSDGFGFAKDGAAYYKIPQLGIVQLDDDVEIGAGNTIDRATMGKTWLKRGVKTDNLVHIAHNVTIGEDTILVAQTGIAGSTKLGDRVIMAGQSAAAGHITIGDDVIVGGRGGASCDVPAGQIVSGAPHMPHKQWLRATKIFQKLPEMRKTLLTLEKRIKELEKE